MKYTLIHPKTKVPCKFCKTSREAERAAYALSRETKCGVEVKREPLPYATQRFYLAM